MMKDYEVPYWLTTNKELKLRSQGSQIQDAHLPETKQKNINDSIYVVLQRVVDKN
jgi:hypothetical protein